MDSKIKYSILNLLQIFVVCLLMPINIAGFRYISTEKVVSFWEWNVVIVFSMNFRLVELLNGLATILRCFTKIVHLDNWLVYKHKYSSKFSHLQIIPDNPGHLKFLRISRAIRDIFLK